eukprot:scaffold676612_cov59-Prasinocladus_malaysianus.AAC.1
MPIGGKALQALVSADGVWGVICQTVAEARDITYQQLYQLSPEAVKEVYAAMQFVEGLAKYVVEADGNGRGTPFGNCPDGAVKANAITKTFRRSGMVELLYELAQECEVEWIRASAIASLAGEQIRYSYNTLLV